MNGFLGQQLPLSINTVIMITPSMLYWQLVKEKTGQKGKDGTKERTREKTKAKGSDHIILKTPEIVEEQK